jgi:hypothetical protein
MSGEGAGMHLRLPALAALALLAAPAGAAERNYTVTGFDRIRVDGPYRVSLKTGVAPFARASGDQAALEAVSIEVQGRTLTIRRKVARGKKAPSGLVTISLGTHELATAWLNGSGGLAIDGVKGQAFQLGITGSGAAEVGDFKVDKLQVSVSGSARVALAGTVQSASFSIDGPASIDALELTAKAASVDASGPATVRLTATDTAKVRANGLAMVELAGEPACTIQPSSTADVQGCR